MTGIDSVALAAGPPGELVAFAAAGGTGQVCFQAMPGGDWTGWGPLAGVPAPLHAGIAAAALPGGGLIAVAVGQDGKLYTIDSAEGAGWPTSWSPLPDTSTKFATGCAVVVKTAGTAVAGAVGLDGALWSVTRQPGQPWSKWTHTAPPPQAALIGGVGACPGPSGTALFVAVGADGALYALPDTTAGWQRVGHPNNTTISGPVTVTVTSGGSTSVVAVGTDEQAYLATLQSGESWTFTPLGQPKPAALLPGTTGGIGVAVDLAGVLTVLAVATDGNAYLWQQSSGSWTPADQPDQTLPLRSVTGHGDNKYVACVVAPTVVTGPRPPGVSQLRLRDVVTASTVDVTVPVGAGCLLAAVQGVDGTPVPGVGLTVVQPNGTTVTGSSPPSAKQVVVGMTDGLVTYLLWIGPPDGTWQVTVDGTDDTIEDFQATVTTLPVLDVQSTIAKTLRHMCQPTAALQTNTSSWGCTACTFGVYIGAGVIAAALVVGVAYLGPESAVIVWLAEFAGLSQASALTFVTDLASKGITSVPEIVAAICRLTRACA